MSADTVETVGRRIAEHAAAYDLPEVWVTLHGGEPLLVGARGLRRVVDILRRALDGTCRLGIGLQTNGLLLDETLADWFVHEGIRVGISLDGGREANDRHRRRKDGLGSYDQVVRAVRLMADPRRRAAFAGVLATVDPANDPETLFRDLEALGPGRIDLLLPHSTWDNPPPAALPARTVYGDWLVAFFDAWYDAPPTIGVRLFEEIMHTLLGGASRSDLVGLSTPQSIVIETDGSYQSMDTLKIVYPGASATGCSVATHTVDDVLRQPTVAAVVSGVSGLSATCLSCPIVNACGGGLYPHRYRSGNGFDNPSVYCHDLGRVITHIDRRLKDDLVRHRRMTTATAG